MSSEDLHLNSARINTTIAKAMSFLSSAQREFEYLVELGKSENVDYAPVEEFADLLGTLNVLKRSTFYSEVEWSRIMIARGNNK